MRGYRKYSIIISVILIAIIFRLTNHINGKEFVDLVKMTVIAFMSSNMVNSIINSIKAKIKK